MSGAFSSLLVVPVGCGVAEEREEPTIVIHFCPFSCVKSELGFMDSVYLWLQGTDSRRKSKHLCEQSGTWYRVNVQ